MGRVRVTADRSALRRAVAAAAAVGGGLPIVSSFLPWISTETEDGGRTTINGWGAISGASSIAGTNLNDVLDGFATYRPGVLGLIFGSITVIAAIALAGVAGGLRPHRVTAALLILTGLACAGWGTFRGLNPGDANVFQAGEVSAAAGPWLTALGGVIILACAAVIFAGVIDPPPPPVRRGIQPR